MRGLALVGDIFHVDATELAEQFGSVHAAREDVGKRAFIFWPYALGNEAVAPLRQECERHYTVVCGDPSADVSNDIRARGFSTHEVCLPNYLDIDWFTPAPWQQLLLSSHREDLTSVVVAGEGKGLAWEIAVLQTFGWKGTSVYLFPGEPDEKRYASVSLLIDPERIIDESSRRLDSFLEELLDGKAVDAEGFALTEANLMKDRDVRRSIYVKNKLIFGGVPEQTIVAAQAAMNLHDEISSAICRVIERLVAAVYVSGQLILVTGEMSPDLYRSLFLLVRQCELDRDRIGLLCTRRLIGGACIAWILKHQEGAIDDRDILWFLVHSLWQHDDKRNEQASSLPYEKGYWRQLSALIPMESSSISRYLSQHGPAAIRKIGSYAKNMSVPDFVAPGAESRASILQALEYVKRRIALCNRPPGELTKNQIYLFSVLAEVLADRHLL